MEQSSEATFGKYTRELRGKKGLSLLDVSSGAGIAYSHMSRIENDSTIPNPETIVKLANFLDGDLTLMLQKANNLPRIILDRLMERDKVVGIQSLRRAISNAPDPSDASERPLENADLTPQEYADLREGIDTLVALRPHARRAILQLISVLRDDEADGEPV